MKSFDRRNIGLAIAIFALAGGLVTLAPVSVEAAHPQKKGAVESRSFRDFVRRLDRAGHDHRVLDRRFFGDLDRAGRGSREWLIFGEYLLAGRLEWSRAEASRYWVRANYPSHYAKHIAAQAPRVFVRLRGAPRLAEALRYELMQSSGRRGVIFVNRPGRADLVVEVEGLISDPLFSPARRSLRTVKFPKRYRRASGPNQLLYARFDRVRERVRIEYDLRLTLRAGGRVFGRERAYGHVSDIVTSARNYRVVTRAGFVSLEVFPSRKIERLYRIGLGQGRRDITASLEERLVHALAHEVRDLRFPSRFELRRLASRGGRYSKGPPRGRGWRSPR